MSSLMTNAPQQPLKVGFSPPKKTDFYATVKEKGNAYFKKSGQSRSGNWEIRSKSLILFTIYALSYGAIVSNLLSGWQLISAYALLGVVTGLIGFNFSHDVMHGSYFAQAKWNHFWSYLFDFNGTSSFIWKLTHNLAHHTYTNIPGFDEDIDKAVLLRLSPTDKLYPFHRYQHLYAPFLYMFTSINWVFYTDYKAIFKLIKNKSIPEREIVLFFILKALNLIVFLFIPLAVVSAPAWQVIVGFLSFHFAAGFTIAVIFQLAHIVMGVEFPCIDNQGKIKTQWGEHEMRTTSNFATNKLLGAFLGGLNYQIEHHLFPYVCHVHYSKLAKVVKETAQEFNLPYHELPTLTAAIASHIKMLKQFGKGEI